MDVKAAPSRLALRRRLSEALGSVYMGGNSILPVFDQTAEQAIAAFRAKPEVFGKLRTYVGAATLLKNRRLVVSLAKILATMP